jgi:hypothetical protein
MHFLVEGWEADSPDSLAFGMTREGRRKWRR